MKKKYIAVSVLLLIAVAITSYFIGYKVAYDRIERSAEAQNNETQTFYATIVEADETHFLVDTLHCVCACIVRKSPKRRTDRVHCH